MPNSKKQSDGLSQLADVLDALRHGLGEDLVSVVLFGSRSRQEARPESDWDLLVLARHLPERTLQRHFFLKRMLPEVWRGRIALLAKTRNEFEARLPALYLDIALDGVVLHDTEGYMAKRLHQLRDLLGQRGLRRERVGREMSWRWNQFPGFDWSLGWETEP
jgi:predicted nucleotidyltransferase